MIYYIGSIPFSDGDLSHHGVEGMKWGVRRYQDEHGHLTELGRERYGLGKHSRTGQVAFNKAKSKVLNDISNTYSPFVKVSTNIDRVMNRGGISRKDAEQCISLANKAFDRVRKVEPTITKDVVSVAKGNGSSMYGLKYRLKQPESIAAKIGSDANEKGISYAEASRKLNDLIRYTNITDDSNFTSNYFAVVNALRLKGYDEIKCKNYFDSYRQGKVKHKAVQSVFEDQNGNRFELQFQTPSSQAAKELKIPIYEERRSSGLSERRKQELEDEMTELAERIPDPKGVFSIKSRG